MLPDFLLFLVLEPLHFEPDFFDFLDFDFFDLQPLPPVTRSRPWMPAAANFMMLSVFFICVVSFVFFVLWRINHKNQG